ncbi:XRE family transcriptional regulator [Mycobacterium sp. PDNC021]|uniref:XRE family transcriptional regulator n=1 Tax=Mycobacterium sp. PDNC021 TaxID=3391399 RepID=UPI003AAB1736
MALETEFEIAFATEPIGDPADARLGQVLALLPDATIASHRDFNIVTTAMHAPDAIEAGIRAAQLIEAAGIRVLRTYQDLVARQDIADRSDMTRQGVGLWVRGERFSETPFPAPVSLVSGGVWLWGDVVEWARTLGLDWAAEEAHFPTLDDHNRLDVMISEGIQQVTVTTHLDIPGVVFSPHGRGTQQIADDYYQRTYALAS